MKKNILFILFVFVLSSCQGWSWMEPKTTSKTLNAEQNIMSATDCTECNEWSWMNGIATASTNTSRFSFIVAEDGDLIFCLNSDSKYDELVVKLDDVELWNRKQYQNMTFVASSQIFCGKVQKGKTISFVGESYSSSHPLSVKDVKVTKSK